MQRKKVYFFYFELICLLCYLFFYYVLSTNFSFRARCSVKMMSASPVYAMR